MPAEDLPYLEKLTALEYDEEYYREHVENGIDYLSHGFWQVSYSLMVSEATLQSSYDRPFVIDAGCACGSILQGFRQSGIFDRVLGIDLNSYMISIGREHFAFSERELVAGSIEDITAEDGSATLLHSQQVLEHIPENLIDAILDEFARVLRPGGRLFLCHPAIRAGETKEIYLWDPTHVNVQPINYWTKKLQKRGFCFDLEAYNKFVQSSHGPTQGIPKTFYQEYPDWNAWTLIKL